MTSATWPAGVRRLAQSYMKDPVQVSIGSLDLTAAHSVRQIIRIVTDEEKTDHLLEFFRSMGENDKVIVFFGKKATVDNIASDLAIANVDCQSMHGGRDQSDREQALEDIRDGGVKILLATDLASRGLDVCNISHVFNYDFPKDIEEYVHRIGRTGRAGKTGEAISLITRGNWAIVGKLIKILEVKIIQIIILVSRFLLFNLFKFNLFYCRKQAKKFQINCMKCLIVMTLGEREKMKKRRLNVWIVVETLEEDVVVVDVEEVEVVVVALVEVAETIVGKSLQMINYQKTYYVLKYKIPQHNMCPPIIVIQFINY